MAAAVGSDGTSVGHETFGDTCGGRQAARVSPDRRQEIVSRDRESSTRVTHVIVAVRGMSRRRAISPNDTPAPIAPTTMPRIVATTVPSTTR